MNPILAAGLLIGVLCGVWTFVMGLTGWDKDPAMANLFFVVIVIEIAGLIWGLRKTAAQGRTYSGQVVAGTLMSIVAGLVIICSSLLFTTVAYPDYFNELNAIAARDAPAAGEVRGRDCGARSRPMAGDADADHKRSGGFLRNLHDGRDRLRDHCDLDQSSRPAAERGAILESSGPFGP